MFFFTKGNRILLREMIKTDFKLRYQENIMGYLWSILKPMMLFAIMYLVFVRFLRFDDGTPHYPISLLLGTVTWSFFTEATNMGMMSIVARGDLLRKVNFSKEIIVLSSVVGAAINYSINLLVVLAFALINGVAFGWQALLALPLFLEVFVLALGMALLLSTFFVKYRDIGPIWEVVLQAGLYATPIIYSLTYIIQKGQVAVAQTMMLNPMAQIIQDLRHFLIYDGSTTIRDMFDNNAMVAIPYLIPVVVLMLGYAIFTKNAKRFAEIL